MTNITPVNPSDIISFLIPICVGNLPSFFLKMVRALRRSSTMSSLIRNNIMQELLCQATPLVLAFSSIFQLQSAAPSGS